MQNKYKRGQRKPEKTVRRQFTCKVGDTVYHAGKPVLVQEVIDQGSERHEIRSYIKGCPFHPDGQPLIRCNIFCGQEWNY